MAATAVIENAPVRSRRKLHIALAFAVIYIAWGGTFLAIRVAVEVVPPFLAAAIRFLTAGLVLYGFVRWRGRAAAHIARVAQPGFAGSSGDLSRLQRVLLG